MAGNERRATQQGTRSRASAARGSAPPARRPRGRSEPAAKIGRISDQAVKARTGKTWAGWLGVLDRAGAAAWDHKTIALWIDGKYPHIGGWWAQMVTVGYEQARGKRARHQKPEGYEISGSKTVGVPLGVLFAAWTNPRKARAWLGDAGFAIRKATANKSLRITWEAGGSVSVNFYAKGPGKSQVALQHGKLPDAAAAARWKAWWAQRLDALQALLEKPRAE